MHAQSPSARVETVAGVHTATFETPRGVIRVHVSADATPGDSISGIILAEPIGATPAAQKANLDELNGLTLEWQGQRTQVSTGRYEWLIPVALRAGTGALSLQDRDGRLVSQASVPVDPVPAAPRPSAPGDVFEFPTDGAIGDTAVIRTRSDGRLSDRTVTLGGTEAELLASSPRQLAFRVPATNPGPVPFRFTSSEPAVAGTLRVLDVSVSASGTQLLRGQRATLTITVRGLSGITAPMTLTVVNLSPAAVRVDDIDRPITISPQQVRREGTFVVTRRITAVQPGPFQIAASVGLPPSAQFDVPRSATRVLAEWQARTGVGMTTGANALVQRSVLEARLDEFLSFQRAHRGDTREVFAALLSDYFFDLRDDGLSRRRASGRLGAGIMLVSLLQDGPGGVTITEREVRRFSFSDYLSRLTERFTARQAAGYLFVRSMTPQAPITIDGQRKGDLTDRRFVTPVGDHQIVVTGTKTCRQLVTVIAFQTRVVEC
jgi:hypothetical protein